MFILIGLALIAGLAFGGVRVLLKKLGPKGRSNDEEMEFISLGLEEADVARRSPPVVPAETVGGPGSGR